MQKTSLPYPKALVRLRKAHDSMREAIGEDIEPRLRGMLQGHAEAAAMPDSTTTTAAPPPSSPAEPNVAAPRPKPPAPRARKTPPPVSGAR
jgi:hypothetical protein